MKILKKKDKIEVMHLQVDREFQQNVITKLNSEFNVEMFRQFKKPLFKSKERHRNASTKRIEPKKVIRKGTDDCKIWLSARTGSEIPSLEKYLIFTD